MNKKQLWLTYGIICFMLVWGWSIINDLKFQGHIDWKGAFSIFNLTQLIYILSCFWATRWAFKKYYTTKRSGALALSVLIIIAGFIVLRYLLEQVLLPFMLGTSNYPMNVHPAYYALDNLYYAVVYLILGVLIFMLDNQLLSQKKEAILKQERTNAELAFLRSQVSPHFLFNSLNNIYALSCNQPDKAPDAILKLSDLTRYMLYEKQEKVPVEKEWQYIENFIALQKLRYEKPLQLQISAEGDLQQLIEPYLLIPFVENAFKHGVVDNPEAPAIIHLKSSDNSVAFSVENNIALQQKDKDGGIGLENTKRRVELLYPGKHEFRIGRADQRFFACLKIKYE